MPDRSCSYRSNDSLERSRLVDELHAQAFGVPDRLRRHPFGSVAKDPSSGPQQREGVEEVLLGDAQIRGIEVSFAPAHAITQYGAAFFTPGLDSLRRGEGDVLVELIETQLWVTL